MAAWFVWAAVWAASTLLSLALKKKPRPLKAQAFRGPSAKEGAQPAQGYGTYRLRDPVCIWFGDVHTSKIKKQGQVVGYRYHAGVQLALGFGPLGGLPGLVYIENKLVAPESAMLFDDFTRLKFNSKDLFGGDLQGGGVSGDLDIYHGHPDQVTSDYLETATMGAVSAQRGLIYLVARGMYWGTSGTLPSIDLVLYRFPNGLGLSGGREKIYDGTGLDANPACMIWDLLTAPKDYGGAAIDPSLIDRGSLVAMGDALHLEGFGLSGLLSPGPAREQIDEILRHVDGIRVDDPATGRISFRLLRPDYNIVDLPIVSPANARELVLAWPGRLAVRNMIEVIFTDRRADFAERSTGEIDRVNLSYRGGQAAPRFENFPLISTRDNAQKAAARLRAATTLSLALASFKADRSLAGLRQGDPFVIAWPEEGVENLVMRVTGIRYGTLASRSVSIDAVQDVFGVATAAFSAPPDSEWSDPAVAAPEPPSAHQVVEAPYALVQDHPLRMLTPFGLAVATPGPGVTHGWTILANRADGGWAAAERTSIPAPRGTLTASIGKADASLRVTGVVDLESLVSVNDGDFAAGVNLLWLDDEFIAFRDVVAASDGTWTLTGLARGCLDTTPGDHVSGKAVWFLTEGWRRIPLIPPPTPGSTRTTHIRFQPYNAQGPLPFEDSPDDSVVVITPFRAQRALVPTAVRINGQGYPAAITGELTVSWQHRSRQGTVNYAVSGAGDALEPGARYRLQIYGELETLVHEETLTGTEWTYAQADEIAESGLGRLNTSLRVVLTALALWPISPPPLTTPASHQAFDHTVSRP